jgi:hypothetical protein
LDNYVPDVTPVANGNFKLVGKSIQSAIHHSSGEELQEGRFTPAQVEPVLNLEFLLKLSGGKPPFLTCNFPELEWWDVHLSAPF